MSKESGEESYRGLLVKLGLGDRNLNAGNRNTLTQRAVELTGKKLLKDLESKRIEYQKAGLQNNDRFHKLLQEVDLLQNDVDRLGELKQYLASRDKALSQARGLDVLMAQLSEHELSVQSKFSELLDGLKLSRSNINTLKMEKVKEVGRVLRSECADYEMRARLSGFQFYDTDHTEEPIDTDGVTETLAKLERQVRQLDELESYIS